jgi:hypothetical protein
MARITDNKECPWCGSDDPAVRRLLGVGLVGSHYCEHEWHDD